MMPDLNFNISEVEKYKFQNLLKPVSCFSIKVSVARSNLSD